MKKLITERLILRNWEERDRALFHEINSDVEVMAFFATRRDREQSDLLMDHVRDAITHDGFGFAAIESRETGECLGFTGLSRVNDLPSIANGTVEIGWRLARRHWGKGYASEAARNWLEYGFETLGLAEIVSFAVHNNHASLHVMERIGMRPCPELNFDHPRVPDDFPALKAHTTYRMTADEYGKLNQAGVPSTRL